MADLDEVKKTAEAAVGAVKEHGSWAGPLVTALIALLGWPWMKRKRAAEAQLVEARAELVEERAADVHDRRQARRMERLEGRLAEVEAREARCEEARARDHAAHEADRARFRAEAEEARERIARLETMVADLLRQLRDADLIDTGDLDDPPRAGAVPLHQGDAA